MVRTTILNISKLLLILFFYIIFARESRASTLLFQENFDDGDAVGWTVVRNTCSSDWLVNNLTYGITISMPCITESIPDQLLIPTNVEYTFEVDMGMPVNINMDRNFVFKYLDSSNWYGIHTFGTDVYLHKVVNGTEYFLTNWHTSYPFVNNGVYRFKVVVKQIGYDIYIDNVLHAFVPEAGITFLSNKAGLQASSGGVPTSQVWFDNLMVTQMDSVTPTPTQSSTPNPTQTPTVTPTVTTDPTPQTTSTPLSYLSVPDIKQFSLPWGSEVYDSAFLWSLNPFISQWGCALTSATMILRFYGHDIWPDELNTWLKSQNDGYIRNGLLNWLAVSRYTRINDSASSPTLVYRRVVPTLENLTAQIKNGRPAILEVPGHFVVGKSITSNSFEINDPAFSNRPTLDSYANELSNLGVYIPTHTDLSYFYLVGDNGLDIKMYNSSNKEIAGLTQIENPIVNPENESETSGLALKSLMFPTPPFGNYKLVISGSEDYSIDSYIYNKEGNVHQNSFSGTFTENKDVKFVLNIGKDSKITPVVEIASIIESLDKAFEAGAIRRPAYLYIRRYLILAQKHILNNKIMLAKSILSVMKMAIRFYTPIFIRPDTSLTLRDDLETLIFSL